MTAQGVAQAADTARRAISGTGFEDVAAQYIRQSKGKADKSEASPETQRDKTREAAQSRGYRLPYKPYEDIGISGWDPTAERPAYDRMMRDAAAGRFRYLFVHYLTRLTRLEPQDALPGILQLWSYGVTIVSVNEGEFRPNDFASLITVIARLEGGYRESANKSIAVHGAKQKARNLGGFVGGQPPYGFTTRKEIRYTEDGNPVAVQALIPREESDGTTPSEAEVIRIAIRRILDGMDKPNGKGNQHDASMTSIADHLTALGIPTRGTSKRARQWWDATSLKRMLADPRIAGYDAEPVYGNADPNNPRKLGKPTGYTYTRDAETGAPLMLEGGGIITPEEFHRAQTWIASRDRGRSAERGESLFSGSKLLDCECSFRMVRFSAKGRPHESYRCPRPKEANEGRTHDGGNTINRAALEDLIPRMVYARIQTAEDDPETLEILAEAARRYGRRTESPVTTGERETLVIERAHVVGALETAYDRENDPEYANPVGRRRWSENVRNLAERLATIDKGLSAIAEAETPRLPLEQWLPEDTDADPVGEGSWWHGASLDDRREFLRLFIDRIVVAKLDKHPGRPKDGIDIRPRVRVEWAKPAQEDA